MFSRRPVVRSKCGAGLKTSNPSPVIAVHNERADNTNVRRKMRAARKSNSTEDRYSHHGSRIKDRHMKSYHRSSQGLGDITNNERAYRPNSASRRGKQGMLKTVVSKADLHDMVKATQQTSTASVKGIPSLQLDLAAANTTTLSNNNKNTPSYTARASRQSTARPSSSNRRVQRSGSMAVIKSSALRRQRPQSATVRSTSSSRASTPASNASSLGLRAGATTRNQKPKRLLSASAQARRERMKHYDELRASQSREKHFSKLSAQQHAKQKKVNQRLLQANNRTFASTLTVTNSRPKLAPPLLSPPATADSALTSSSTASSANNSVRNSSSGKRRATMIGAGNWVEDASKTLDQLANAALVAVAREKQQIVTRANKKVAKDDDIEGDLMMRSFDQREIDRRQQEDVERHEREKHAAVILRQQIADRVQAREQAEQQRLNERNLINERHRRLQEEEERERQNKLKRAVQLQQQQVESNQVLMQAKTQKRQEEMLEDLRNAEYLIELAAKKQAEEDERLRRQKARDDECFRLRAMQQRVIDRRGDEDAARARKWQAALEKKENDREARREQERRNRIKEMNYVLKEQIKLKKQKQQTEALEDTKILERNLRIQYEQMNLEDRNRSNRINNNRRYAQDLLEQVKEKEDARFNERSNVYKERERVEQEEYEKSVEFDRIKKAKISALRKKGVPERFLVDLGNFEL